MIPPITKEEEIEQILDNHAEYYIRETIKYIKGGNEPSPAKARSVPQDIEAKQAITALLRDTEREATYKASIATIKRLRKSSHGVAITALNIEEANIKANYKKSKQES